MAATTNMRHMMPLNPAAFAAPYFLSHQAFPPPTSQAGWPNFSNPNYVRQPSLYKYPFGGYLAAPSSSTELVLRNAPQESAPEQSTSTALVRVAPVRRDTPSSYPVPPTDDEANPPVPIHPYLYHDGCPVTWDVRTNLRHSARRHDGERLSSLALKANATNTDGPNRTTMRIISCDPSFPWTIVVKRESGVTVGDIFMELGLGLDAEITDPEKVIAGVERVAPAEASRKANEGTGAVKTRPEGDEMRRVDWLGTRTAFKGLVHSSAKEFDDLVRRKVHVHDRPNTWVLVLQERPKEIEEAESNVS